MEALYKDHLTHITREVTSLLNKEKADVLIFHAGSPFFYHADDREIPFRTNAHFARFTPVSGPNHIIIVDRNEPIPLLIEFRPDDFWEEQTDTSSSFWRQHLPVEIVSNTEELRRELIKKVSGRKIIFIGDERAEKLLDDWSIPTQPKDTLSKQLDECRVRKDPYEIACIEKATEIAVRGHMKLQEMLLDGSTEREMYYAFLDATNRLPYDFPYEPIIALNEKSATLHYRNKRHEVIQNSVLLVDAGVSICGYASDITRTTVTNDAHPVFASMLKELDVLQQKLCSKAVPEVEFIELHNEAHVGIAEILTHHQVLNCSATEATLHGLTQPFFPHGLGHMLGLQVHDVGNTSPISENHPLRKKYPRVRTNRKLESGMVTTIEPGIYFIPLLLKPFRTGKYSTLFNWQLIDELIPYGGMRIEDNLVVTEHGSVNLTRKYL